MFNKSFYPTPESLIKRMIDKVSPEYHHLSGISILEPSAGKGDIIEYIKKNSRAVDIKAIEIELDLQHILRGKGIHVIDSDFLQYSGTDRFDLIIGNPPFGNGELHLLKAIDIMFNGEIVFLLNAETLKNPYSANRELLVKKLNDLNAEIEYIENAFVDAERKTGVEIALIHIKIENNYDSFLFDGDIDKANTLKESVDEKNEVASSDMVKNLVESYNETLKVCLETIKGYYSNYNRVIGYLSLSIGNADVDNHQYKSNSEFNYFINKAINNIAYSIRTKYWNDTLNLPEVQTRLTIKKRREFYDSIKSYSYMDFTERNIRNFILNLVKSYEETLSEAVTDLFDIFTIKYHYSTEFDKNRHYFDGWKTNEAFFVNSKVIRPMVTSYDMPFFDSWTGKNRIHYSIKEKLNDIDLVMRYFKFYSDDSFISIVDALEANFEIGKTRGIESTFFKISVYKKGTIHLTFKDEDIRRRFNIIACKYKKWLPQDYGKKHYKDMSKEEKDIVSSFESEKDYTSKLNQIGFSKENHLQIEGF